MTFFAAPAYVDDETLLSQLRRIAGANALSSIASMFGRAKHGRASGASSLASPSIGDLIAGPSQPWLQMIAEVAGTDTARLWAGTRLGGKYRSLRTWDPRSYYRLMTYCPTCLAGDGAWRLLWMLPYVEACPTHRVVLVDHLSKCASGPQKHRQWTRFAGPLIRCRACGHDLLDTSTTTASSDSIERQLEWLELENAGRLRLFANYPANADRTRQIQYSEPRRGQFFARPRPDGWNDANGWDRDGAFLQILDEQP